MLNWAQMVEFLFSVGTLRGESIDVFRGGFVVACWDGNTNLRTFPVRNFPVDTELGSAVRSGVVWFRLIWGGGV